MARRKRHLPRYRSLLAGIALLVAERRLRQKMGSKVSWPLGVMGKGLLWRRVAYYSPTGVAILLGSRLARRRLRQR